MSNWQKVYSDRMEYRVEIVKAILEDNNLHPVIINRQDAAYHFGQFEVHVAPKNVIKSIKIIKDDIKFT